jgi:superfamily II DNA or RNA helicase
VISTYSTAKKVAFINTITKIKENSMIIADECHNIGSPESQKIMEANFSAKLGLSATPFRWRDEGGTKKIFNYFVGENKKESTFIFDLEKAIEKDYLTKYYYLPIVVKLNKEEQQEYDSLTSQYIIEQNKKEPNQKRIDDLLRKRKGIISRAESKYDKLSEMLKNKEITNHTLIYTAPEIGIVNRCTKMLNNCDLKVHSFTSVTLLQLRQDILTAFDEERIDVVVAIKCLDEGVDVPSTRTAIIMASTTNPREYIQRRGRVLRKYRGKDYAVIYDFVVFPFGDTGEALIKNEMKRVSEFSNYAENKIVSPDKNFKSIPELLDPFLKEHNLVHLRN